MPTVRREFPPTVSSPATARQFGDKEFTALEKVQMDSAPSACAGHLGTNIWYSDGLGFVVEVLFERHPPMRVLSACTFKPTFGMDRFDGELAQDAEEYALHERLGYMGTRLAIYAANKNVPVEMYLQQRGWLK